MTPKIVDCLSMPTIRRLCVTRKAVCPPVHVSDIKEPLCDAEIVGCLLMSTIGRRCMTIKAVCMHVTLYMNITNISRAYYK